VLLDLQIGNLGWREVYKLCIGFINPRPIAMVSSIAADGRMNLAPFSFYNMVAARPPTVMISTGIHRDGTPKDTFRNVTETREFVVATATTKIARQMVATAAELPYGESEFTFSGLTPAPALHVRAALVRESPVNIECRLSRVLTLGDQPGGAHLLFGEIVAVHVDDALLTPDGLIDPHKLQTVGRLGGTWYANVTQPYEMHIPAPPGKVE
jgi:flavin reductase (DIM6/NTAB) family NADH-FMN oxidoreductase RutF